MKPTYFFDITNDSFNQIAPFEFSQCNEFVWGEEFYKHSEFLYSMSYVFLKLHLMKLDFKPKIALCLSNNCFGRFNKTDKEPNEESIISFFKLLQIPKPGIQLGLYLMEDSEIKKKAGALRPPFTTWRFKESWTGGGNYILKYKTRGKTWLKPPDHSWLDHVDMEIKTLGYGQTVLEHYDLIKNCEILITQNGSGLQWGILMDCPVFYDMTGTGYDLSWPYGDENLFGHVLMETSAIGMNPDTLTFEDGKVLNKRYSSYVATYNECNNIELLDKMLKTPKSDYKKLQNEHIKKYRDVFDSWMLNVKNLSSEILNK